MRGPHRLRCRAGWPGRSLRSSSGGSRSQPSASLIVIVASGATVRLTGSGLGCPEWPTCTTQHALPQSYHSYIEFGNRVVSAVTIFTTLALAVAAWLTRGLGRRGRWLATAVFVGTLAQAPLGAIIVYYDLNPYLVITHLLLSFTLVSLAVLTLLEATRLVRGEGSPLPWIARLGGLVLVVAVTVLAISGTVATAAGRFPGSSGSQIVPRLGSFYPAVYWHVRAVAVFGVVFVSARGLGVGAAQHVPVAAARLRGAARDPRRPDGDRGGAVPDVRRRAVVARAAPRGDGRDARGLDGRARRASLAPDRGRREATTRLIECRS